MKSKKNTLTTIIFVLILLIGLSVLLYPTFSDWWNKSRASHTIAEYQEAITNMDKVKYEKLLADAKAYNEKLSGLYAPFENYEEIDGYEEALNVLGNGVIGYISIPAIDIELPVYHGTSEKVLNVAVGHLQGSSLPVGGENTHAVLSGHRGLPSARLFTDLDKIVEGDIFTLNVLDEMFTYEVEKIFIVKPSEMDKLAIIPEADYVTLLTCTPYGINTHRLLIRAHRIETIYDNQQAKAPADAIQVDPLIVGPIIAVPLFIGLILYWSLSGKKQKQYDFKLEYKNKK